MGDLPAVEPIISCPVIGELNTGEHLVASHCEHWSWSLTVLQQARPDASTPNAARHRDQPKQAPTGVTTTYYDERGSSSSACFTFDEDPARLLSVTATKLGVGGAPLAGLVYYRLASVVCRLSSVMAARNLSGARGQDTAY